MGTPLDLSTVTPTRSGYTFTGWLDADGKPVTTVSGTATVTAQWTESSNTQYRVFHWQENANDDGYSLKETETQKGKTGSETKAAAKKYDGFTAETITQQTIAGDGSTIVNVYYKRNVYIVNFYDRKGKKESQIASSSWTPSGRKLGLPQPLRLRKQCQGMLQRVLLECSTPDSSSEGC